MDVAVVGSGPNGLAAASILARAGLAVTVYEESAHAGGGMRSSALTLPGFLHDVCSAVHPMGLASPFFRAFDLSRHGVEMLQPDVAYAHPLDQGRAGVAWRDLERTADGLGADAPSWRSLLGPLVRRYDEVVGVAMSDLRRPPASPLAALQLGLRVLEQGTPLWGARFRADVAPAMLTGVAAHAIAPPRSLAPAGAGMLLASLAHAVGWPLPRGGSQAIVDALVADIEGHGGKVCTGHRVDDLVELSPVKAILLDTSPREFLRIAGDRLPSRYVAGVGRFRHGGAACKVDFALSGPVPWSAPGCDRAGSLHVVGSRAEAMAAEQAVAAGRHPDRPYVLVVQPGVVDDGRAPAGHQTLWTYAHVPQGSSLDVSDAVIRQIERFAPGFRDLILAQHVITGVAQQGHNRNYVGGDIMGGAMTMWQTAMRPLPSWDPYRTPVDGVFLCSASTPPGPGVHGMGGMHAARRVLRRQFGLRVDPADLLRSR